MGCLITLSVGMMHAMHAALLFVYAPTITDTASHCMFHSFLPLLSMIVLTSFPLLSLTVVVRSWAKTKCQCFRCPNCWPRT